VFSVNSVLCTVFSVNSVLCTVFSVNSVLCTVCSVKRYIVFAVDWLSTLNKDCAALNTYLHT